MLEVLASPLGLGEAYMDERLIIEDGTTSTARVITAPTAGGRAKGRKHRQKHNWQTERGVAAQQAAKSRQNVAHH